MNTYSGYDTGLTNAGKEGTGTMAKTIRLLVALALASAGVGGWISIADAATCLTCHAPLGSSADIRPVDASYRNITTGGLKGSHGKHMPSATTPVSACADCHGAAVNSYTANHRNGTIETPGVGYSKGASFPQAGNPALGTCNAASCHDNGKGVLVTTPTWGTASPACTACHALVPGDSHSRHITGTSYKKTVCADCHAVYVQGTTAAANHLNSTVEVTTGGYPSPKVKGSAFASCATSYCHSSGQSANGTSAIPVYASVPPVWGGTIACGSCHATTAMATGTHSQHIAQSIDCGSCHTGATASAYNSTIHVDGQINVAAGFSYANQGAPGNGYSSCSATVCHGSGATPAWGSNTTQATCTKCHGVNLTSSAAYTTDPKTAAPGYNGTGRSTGGATAATDPKVGAHDTHLRGLNNISNPIACNECHTVPATVAAAGHIDSALPAEVPMNGALARTNSAVPAYAGSTCTATYCHFGKPTGAYSPATVNAAVVWTDTAYLSGTTADCQKCHLSPPSNTGTHAGVTFPSGCTSCHSHVSVTGAITDKTKHINGTVDGGISSGGSPCYGCHSAYNLMNSSASVFHHVLDDVSPDQAPNTGVYPSSQTVLACTSCHTDHNYFNLNKGANLRTAYNAAAGATNNRDFSTASPYGLCVSCHSTAQTKSTAQTVAGTLATIAIDGSAAGFQASMHNYTTTSLFGSLNFSANCVKCHSDEQVKDKQTSANRFGSHYSAQRSLLNPMGAAPQAAAGADFCYRCHSKSTDSNPGGGAAKATSFKDYFGSKTMTAASEDIFSTIAGTPGGGATTSTNTLYFKPVTQETAAGTLPAAHLSTADTFTGGTFVARSMSPYAPTVANESQDVVSNAVIAGTQNWRRVSFISPLVATSFTTTAAAWTINIYDRESSANANARARYAIYTIDSTGGLKSTIVARANGATEMATTAAPGTMQTINTAAGSAVAVAVGDRIVVDLEIQTLTVTTAGSYQMTYFFGSTAQSNVVMPSTATFTYTNQGINPTGRHNVATYKGSHKDDETRGDIAATKHVECVDCHDPHLAKSGNHTAGSATLAGVLTGVAGVGVTAWGAANWAGVTTYNPSTTSAALITATAEWMVCFKCHSGANANVANWGGTGAAAFTDIGLEFNPNNKSGHPVIQSLNNYPNSVAPKALAASQMKAPWTSVGTQIMTCSDCHATDSAASKGPHGSSVKWMLTGTYKNWPYTAAANNGTSGTTGFITAAVSPPASFCENCHDTSFSAAGHGARGTAINRSNHYIACVQCHIRVPHGGKVSRLIAGGTNTPARYRPDGNGGATPAQMQSFTKLNTGYSESNCQHSCTGTHSSAATETW
jgi:predicted CxxxxCH...CXXCH cytochrome family protein